MRQILLLIGLLLCVGCQTAVSPNETLVSTETPVSATIDPPTATPMPILEPTPTEQTSPTSVEPPPAVTLGATLQPVILNRYPHDNFAFTQGLLWHEGQLYESTGLYGQSDLRRVDITTGEVQQITPIADTFFGEGLTLVDDRLIMITWREQTALVFDRDTFEQISTFSYQTEGWGLCYDGTHLYMSDGTATITQRDPETFEPLGQMTVTGDTGPINRLNELECVGDYIYANVWLTDTILVINKTNGQVQATIDASTLLTPQERTNLGRDAVLNGIAYNPESQTFYLTGKLWTQLFEVTFEER